MSDYEYGYSHDRHLNERGEYAPISGNSMAKGRVWFATRAEAAKVLANDNRWRVKLFLIRRPIPAQPERIS